MKKIINGKRYDTDTARELGRDSYSNRRDFHHWIETLYRKNTGEYFLHGVGGPATKYAVTVGQNQWEGGEKIIPLTEQAAREWAEEHLSADQYEQVFGLVDEGEAGKKTVTFSLPLNVIEMIRSGAAAEGISLSDFVAEKIKA